MSTTLKTAMVLAAGLGTRMRPLTDSMPKPLVALNGRPLIDHVLDRIAAAGITTAVVNVHYHADKLIQHLAARQNPRIVISDERSALLDTGGSVKHALKALGPAPFLSHNSDSIWLDGVGSNLARLAAAWDGDAMDGLLLLAQVSSSIGYDGRGDFTMAADGRLLRRTEHCFAPFVFTGVAILHPRLLDATPDGPFSLNTPFNRAIEHGRLFGLRLEGVWMHVGTPQAITQAEQAMDGTRDA